MENTEEPCIICFEEDQEKILFDCNHSICLVCYSKLLENDNVLCPICRRQIEYNCVNRMSISIPNSNVLDNRATMNLRGILFLLSVIGSVIIILVVITNYK